MDGYRRFHVSVDVFDVGGDVGEVFAEVFGLADIGSSVGNGAISRSTANRGFAFAEGALGIRGRSGHDGYLDIVKTTVRDLGVVCWRAGGSSLATASRNWE